MLLYCLGFTSYSAFVISLIISQIILNIMVPMYNIDIEQNNYGDIAIYSFIQIGTIIFVYIFAILCILSKGNNCGNTVCVINNKCC